MKTLKPSRGIHGAEGLASLLKQRPHLLPTDQQGFIPMMIMIVMALVGIIYFAYTQVAGVQR